MENSKPSYWQNAEKTNGRMAMMGFFALVVNLFIGENVPFYIYKIASLIKFLPPIWVTWFLWIKRGGFKR